MREFLRYIKMTAMDRLLDTRGRSSRMEFGYWFLLAIIIYGGIPLVGDLTMIILGILVFIYSAIFSSFGIFSIISYIVGLIINALMYFCAIIMLLPTTTLLIRRLHDTNRSGKYLLLNLLPVVGQIYLLYICLTHKGDEGENHYGKPPQY